MGYTNKRPSNRELYNKVRDALQAVRDGRCMQAVTKHITMDYESLGVDSEDDFWHMLVQLLEELIDVDPTRCYAGGRPPQRSYESQLSKMELWAYAWNSQLLGKRMYLKFCIKDNYYYHVDCHEDRKS